MIGSMVVVRGVVAVVVALKMVVFGTDVGLKIMKEAAEVRMDGRDG